MKEPTYTLREIKKLRTKWLKKENRYAIRTNKGIQKTDPSSCYFVEYLEQLEKKGKK